MKRKPAKRRPPRQKEQPQPDFFTLLRQGTQALHQGKTGTAIELLERAHQLDAENGDAILNLGGAYTLSKKFKKAVALLEPLSKRDSQNPMVWTNLGAAYLGNPVLAQDKNQLQAIAAFERAIELNPMAPNVAYNLGLIYRDRKEFDQASHWFHRALEANPNDKDARYYIEQLKAEG
jgi:tetratricopeptide (TPR) repeat protein